MVHTTQTFLLPKIVILCNYNCMLPVLLSVWAVTGSGIKIALVNMIIALLRNLVNDNFDIVCDVRLAGIRRRHHTCLLPSASRLCQHQQPGSSLDHWCRSIFLDR